MSNERTKRFDIVLLDADETVFDFKKAEAHSLKGVMEHFGVEFNDDRLKLYSEINLSLWKQLEKKEVTRDRLKTLRFERFFSAIGVEGLDYDEINLRYLNNLSNSTFLLDGAKEFVEELHKYAKIYIATNGLTIAQTGRLSQSAIRDYVDGMFISEQIGYAKPDKAYFDYILDSIGCTDKSRVIILGDSLTSDMLGGRNAGITTCLYNSSGTIVESDLCDYQITDYGEFFDILFE